MSENLPEQLDMRNQTLLKMARYDIYRVNGFRVLGIPVMSSSKEISSYARKLELMEKYGNSTPSESAVLPLYPSPDGDARREAQQRLMDPELRFIDEFFWFWPLSPNSREDDALSAMQRGEAARAYSIWRSHETEGSESNVSNHNFAVLYHAMALDIERMEVENTPSKEKTEHKRFCWEQSFSRWQQLIDDDNFWERLKDRIFKLDDPRLTTGTIRRIRDGLPAALLSINAILATYYKLRAIDFSF